MSRIEDVMHKAYKLGIQDNVLVKVAVLLNYNRTINLNTAYENAFQQVKKEFSYDNTNKDELKNNTN